MADSFSYAVEVETDFEMDYHRVDLEVVENRNHRVVDLDRGLVLVVVRLSGNKSVDGVEIVIESVGGLVGLVSGGR